LCPPKPKCGRGLEAVDRNSRTQNEMVQSAHISDDFDFEDQFGQDEHECESCQHTQRVTKFLRIGLQCPDYICVPITGALNLIIDGEATCSIQGKIINTFDGLKYEYPICNHILSKHNQGNWQIACKYDKFIITNNSS
jgi:hypothetical protein